MSRGEFPLQTVVETVDSHRDLLACGHWRWRAPHWPAYRQPVRRRCERCAINAPPDVPRRKP